MANTLTPIIEQVITDMQSTLRGTGALFNATSLVGGSQAAALGQAVTIPIPSAQATYDVTPGAVPPALVDSTITNSTLTLDQQKGSRFHLTGEEVAAINAGEFRGGQIAEAVASLVDEAELFLQTTLKAGAGTTLGVADTNPVASDPDILMDCWQTLFDAKAPQDMGSYLVTSGGLWAQLGKLEQFQKLNEAPRGVDFATGQIGTLANFNCQPTQAIVDEGAGGTSNIFAHRLGSRMAIRPSAEPEGGDVASDSAVVSDPVTGLSMRLAQYKGYHASQYELSWTYGAVVDRSALVGILLS